MKSKQTLIDGVHDPTIIKVAAKYYLVSTDTTQPLTSGIPIRSSDDLIHWKFEKTAFEGVPEEANKWSSAEGIWAPEIIKVNNEYRMYYSASTFGSTTSYIGLATASHPLGLWEDRGAVVKTNSKIATHNAIDANICYDINGNQWMVYGSFFGGIYIVEIDSITGKCVRPDDYGICIAIRPQTVEGAIEGPYIIYNEQTQYFYLFVSFDSLNDSYNIRVARSKNIDGPYKDINGNSMLNMDIEPSLVGTKILGSYKWLDEEPLYAPGHNSIFTEEETKKQYLVHHIRRKPFSADFFVQIRSLLWLDDGWPIVAGEEFDGKIEVFQYSKSLDGDWEIIVFQEKSDLVLSKKINMKNNKFFDESGQVILHFDNELIFFRSALDKKCLTGRTSEGQAIIGRKMI